MFTIYFPKEEVMLAFLRNANDAKSVIAAFNELDHILGRTAFSKLFPVLLTDNGSEFSNPSAIEFDEHGLRRTTIFYCDPMASYQKPCIENNHEMIRRIVPKGHSFDHFTQPDIQRMMSHINSYARKKLNDRLPFDAFSFLHGAHILNQLGILRVNPSQVLLTPSLLKK